MSTFHKTSWLSLLAIGLMLAIGSMASAEIRRCPVVTTPCPTPRNCPPDYCRKCIPGIPCPTSNYVCDDYCRKVVPCTPCATKCFVCDDYCAKAGVCMPKLPCSPWLKCAAPTCGCTK